MVSTIAKCVLKVFRSLFRNTFSTSLLLPHPALPLPFAAAASAAVATAAADAGAAELTLQGV